ncbi:LuxR C-terminal-related transcriptional regulator [Aeromicrobium sp. CF4.19]|uniref:LuxR C-terminal-related transcriptional regulator n=1 Tax=Aeromicrobium sp. CF4.19 TaxID=3373082 RepID=UPI003EE69D6D
MFDVLFGGGVERSRLHLTDFSGTRSKVLRGLVIEAERGAGGRAMVEHRPVRVDHYRTARSITHDYLHEITREGILALVAAPVVVNRRTRGVLYGAMRSSTSLGDRSAAALEEAAQSLGHEWAIHEEVESRLHAMTRTIDHTSPREERLADVITESYLLLREVAADVEDVGLRTRLRQVEESLRRLTARTPAADSVNLTPREIDVLLYLGLGCSNSEIGERLRLSTATVKTYVRNLMAKLEVSTRHAGVVEARRRGLIP